MIAADDRLILPFLGPIRHLLTDPTISDVMVQPGKVFIDRGGVVSLDESVIDEESLRTAIESIAGQLKLKIGIHSPILDARLPNGSRVAAMYPPVSVDGASLTVRMFGGRFTCDQLRERGSLPYCVQIELCEAIDLRKNVLVSGGTGSGKTTLVNAFIRLIPPGDRLIVIEKPIELLIEHENVLRWEARDEMPGYPAVEVSHLLRAALRHRPDRIVIGEVRDHSAYDLLQALNTGHSGTFSTIHADSAVKALFRLSQLALTAHPNLDMDAMRSEVSEAIDYVAHVYRFPDGQRRVTELFSVDGYDPGERKFTGEMLYRYASEGG